MSTTRDILTTSLEKAVSQMSAAVIVAEATTGRIVLWNQAAAKILGYSASEASEMNVEALVPERLKAQLRADVSGYSRTGHERYTDSAELLELPAVRKDGAEIWIEMSLSPVEPTYGAGSERERYVLAIVRDITERKRAEEALSHNEERFRLLVEGVKDYAIFMLDTEGRVTTWNPGAQRIKGYDAEEITGEHFSIFYTDEDVERGHPDEVLSLAAADGHYEEEGIRVRKDGSTFWANVLITALRDEAGNLRGFAKVTRDITERKRSEEALRYQSGLTKTLTEKAADPMFMLDAEGRITYANPATEQMFGWSTEELLGEVLHDKLHHHYPDGRPYPRSECPITAALATQHTLTDHEDVFFRKDGSMVDISCSYAPFVVEGEAAGAVVVVRDISDRKQAERDLKESNRRTENILESITDAFYALDHEWRLTYLNERALRFASQLAGEEFTLDDLIGRTLWETLPAIVGTSIEDEYRRAVREQRTAVFEYPYPGGDPIFEVHAYPSEQGLSIYFQDVTERKRAEAELETQARQQAVVADFGLRALANDDLQVLMDEAVALVARTLEAEYSEVVEILSGGEELLIVAGVGWDEGVVGDTIVGAGFGSQAGYALILGEPVIVEDLATETRFDPPPLLVEHGAVGGMSVVIHGRQTPFGVICADTTSHRTFSEDDINFLQAVANVLATAIERGQAQEKLEEVREAERSRIARDLHDDALQDLSGALVDAQRLKALSTDSEASRLSERLLATLDRVEPHLRGAIYDLSLEREHDRPFDVLLEELVELQRTIAPHLQIALEVQEGFLEGGLGETGRQLLRIIGEALTNARRHSGARNVRVVVRTSEGKLFAEVSDDGRGFDPVEEPPATTTSGTGIRGMRERANLLGGEIKIESERGKGTKVRLELPLMKDHEEPEEAARVLLVEDHATVRDAVTSAFEGEADLEVVGQAASLAEARRQLEGIDVAVVDLGLPDGYGGDLIKELREANPRALALVLSASLDRGEIARAVEAGAAGILNKTAHLEEVVEAVRRLRRGETLLPLKEIVELLRFAGRRRDEEHEARKAIEKLTPREREVLQALAEGLDSEGIAEKLHIALRTERNHMSSILSKLEVHSQLQALVFALRHGVVKIP